MSLFRFIRPGEIGRPIGLGFLALFLVLPLILFWISAVRGLEETDEAHYLLTALDPWLIGGRGLLFGFGLHPFWLLGGETVSGFRRVGILATLLATLPMAAAVWRTVRQQGLPVLLAWSVFPSLFLSSLVIFSDGIRTPSYNWLVFLGSLCLAGSAWQAANLARGTMIWGILAGIGFGLLVLGKWMAAPFYGIFLAAFFWWLRQRPDRRTAAWKFAAGFLLAAGILGAVLAVWISPAAWERTWWTGKAQWEFGSHTNLAAWYAGNLAGFSWRYVRTLLWVAGAALLLWAGLKCWKGKWVSLRQLATPLFWVAGILSLAQGFGVGGAENFRKESLFALVWLTGLGLVSFFPFSGNSFARAPGFWMSWLLLFPWLNGLGSGTHLVDYVGHGVVFLTAAGWLLLAQAWQRGLSESAVWAAVLVLALVQSSRAVTSLDHQFRLGSLRGQKVWVVSGPEAGRLQLDAGRVEKLRVIDQFLGQAGFRPGDPVVGISELCGLVYLLGGRSPGVPFYFGYDETHCLPYARKIVAAITEKERDSSWVIFREGTLTPGAFGRTAQRRPSRSCRPKILSGPGGTVWESRSFWSFTGQPPGRPHRQPTTH